MDVEHHDVVVDILRHLPPRSLAVCRCVCAAWRATIDVHRLLRADLLPLSLDGVMYGSSTGGGYPYPELYSRRSTGRKVVGGVSYLDGVRYPVFIIDCRNGLLLLSDNVVFYVVNPATRQSARLPSPRRLCLASSSATAHEYCRHCRCLYGEYLVFDPTVSPHYEVFYVPSLPSCPSDHVGMHRTCGHDESATEWPPSPFIMHVFSSETWCWKQRSFVRQAGDDAVRRTTIADVRPATKYSDTFSYYYSSAYWHGDLYIPCGDNIVLRLNLSDDKYHVIKMPVENKSKHPPRLGKSEKGVYCAFDCGFSIFQVWFLDESDDHINWVLKNEINLQAVKKNCPMNPNEDGQWILQSYDQMKQVLENNVKLESVGDNNKAQTEDDFDWDDSNNKYVVDTKDWHDDFSGSFYCLGFHPYREIVLFHGFGRAVAYYFNSSKIQYLGWLEHMYEGEVNYPYTPCWVRELPGSSGYNVEAHILSMVSFSQGLYLVCNKMEMQSLVLV